MTLRDDGALPWEDFEYFLWGPGAFCCAHEPVDH